MNFTPALPLSALLMAVLAVPIGILLLYFLKLKREPVEVPSTYLWSRTIEDLHVNSLIQRLRNSLLLFLQLAAVLLAGFALFRPGVRAEKSSLGRVVYLLDTSASMQAPANFGSDVESSSSPKNQTRFDSAIAQIGQYIDAMTDDESAMLITFSDRAEVMQAFTSDRSRLRDALKRCRVTNRPTDVLGALRAADGLANPRRSSEIGDVNDVQVADAMPAELMLFSDGGFQNVTEFNLGNLKPTYHAIGSAQTKNLAIASFSANRNLQNPNEIEVFATISNTGSEALQSTASLYVEGQLADASEIALEAEEQTGLTFTVESSDAVAMRLQLDRSDDLEVDNQAYAALTPAGLVSILLVTEGNRPLEIGLTTTKLQQVAIVDQVSPEYMTTKAYQQRAEAGSDDLIIYDRCGPKKMPATNTFTIGQLPNDGWSWSSEASSLTLIDIDRSHPVLRYLELYSLLVFSGRSINGPNGTTSIIESDQGTVMAINARGSYQDLVLGFELVRTNDQGETEANTNWYAERSWPVFLFNVMRHLAGAAQSSAAPSFQPGETILSRLESSVQKVQVLRDDAEKVNVSVDRTEVGDGGIVEVTETAEVGNFRIVAKDSTDSQPSDVIVDRFAINLFDAQESDLATRADVELGYKTVEAFESTMDFRREYWRWLLVIALGLLAVEWWVYNQRLA